MGNKYKGGFEDLEVWKEARKYRIAISGILKKIPVEEKYKLIDQLYRSSRSVHAKVMENSITRKIFNRAGIPEGR